MGRGWLKETVKEINTTPIFAAAATTHEQSLGVCMTIYDTEGPISGLGTSANISMRKHISLTGVVSLVCKVTRKQWHIEETYVELGTTVVGWVDTSPYGENR